MRGIECIPLTQDPPERKIIRYIAIYDLTASVNQIPSVIDIQTVMVIRLCLGKRIAVLQVEFQVTEEIDICPQICPYILLVGCCGRIVYQLQWVKRPV